MLPTNRGFWLSFLYSIITLGIYPLYLIHAFAKETNIACIGDGKYTHGLIFYFFINLITLGIYGIIWNCQWIARCDNYLILNRQQTKLQVSTYLLSVFFGWLTLGIFNLVVFCKMLYLQNAVNRTYNSYSIAGEDSINPAIQ